MPSNREAILARLLVIAQAVPGIVSAYRNRDAIDEGERPAVQILDADETADDSDPRTRPAHAPRRVGMSPEIYILLGSEPENVGTELNALQEALIESVMADADLRALLIEPPRYEGAATSLARGRMMEGEMGVSFTFSYLWRFPTPA